VGRPEGLCAVKGDPIPWVVQVVGNKFGTWVLGDVVCGEWTTRRVRSPCGLIASTQGGLLLRGNEQQLPMAGRFILHMQPVG
jgi:hypothetical protein